MKPSSKPFLVSTAFPRHPPQDILYGDNRRAVEPLGSIKRGVCPRQARPIEVSNFVRSLPSAHNESNTCCSVPIEGFPGKIPKNVTSLDCVAIVYSDAYQLVIIQRLRFLGLPM